MALQLQAADFLSMLSIVLSGPSPIPLLAISKREGKKKPDSAELSHLKVNFQIMNTTKLIRDLCLFRLISLDYSSAFRPESRRFVWL